LSEEGLKNVEVIKGEEDDPRLPAGQLDAVLIVNSYHEMTAHEAILRHTLAALKQGGVFVLMEGIWDSRETKSRDEQIKHHQLAPQLAKQEVEKAGFDIVEVRDPFIERPPDEDGKSRWWVLVARKPLR
jgi:predicted methyltransferase